MMIGGVLKCFGIRENYPIVIGEVLKVFRNKGEISDRDRRATKCVSEQEKLNNMYSILINVTNNK